jgi:hypothetical protein
MIWGGAGIEVAIERLVLTSRGMAFWHGRERDLLKNLYYDFVRLFTWIHVKV